MNKLGKSQIFCISLFASIHFMKEKFISKKYTLWFLLAIMTIFPVVLILLPKSQFDTGPTTCLYTLISGENCMGCGMTRACMRLIHFDFRGAWKFNAMSLIVFPILVFFYGKYFFNTLLKLRNDENNHE